MSWQDLPIYSRNDGSFIISYNNAPYHVAKTGGGFTEQYPALVTWEEVSAFVSENPDKVTPEVPVTVTPATPPSARTVNNVTPNSAGNVTLNIPQGTVTSINNVTPNSAGRVTLAPVNITGAGQVVLVSAVRKHITFGDWYYYIPAGGSWYAYTYRQTGSQQGNNNVSRPVYGWLWSVRAGGSAVQCPTAPPDSTYAICIRIS